MLAGRPWASQSWFWGSSALAVAGDKSLFQKSLKPSLPLPSPPLPPNPPPLPPLEPPPPPPPEEEEKGEGRERRWKRRVAAEEAARVLKRGLKGEEDLRGLGF